MNQNFAKNLIKGKIAETIFELMFRESEQYTVLNFGYEYVLPEVAQYQHLLKKPEVIETLRHTPDFVLISKDRSEVNIVEVKYRAQRDDKEITEIAQTLINNAWPSPWLFIASPDGFFYEPCHTIIQKKGQIGELYKTHINEELQNKYIKLLNEFELNKTI